MRSFTLLRWASGLASAWLLWFGTASPAQEAAPPPKSASYPPLPDPKRVFRLESEATLIDRMIQGAKTSDNPLKLKYDFVFPEYPPVPKEVDIARRWPPLTEFVEPAYVCYRRLYFEQINSERYGWDLGVFHPLLSAGIFFFDVAALPYHAGTEPLRRYECNTGYYLPGDPVPFLFYPPELSLTGALTEAAVIGLGVIMFP